MCRPDKCFVYVAADLDAIAEVHRSDAVGVWKNKLFREPPKLMGEFPAQHTLKVAVKPETIYKYYEKAPKLRHAIAGVGGSESCFMYHTVPVSNLDEYDAFDNQHRDSAALEIAVKYISDRLFKLIRGEGLAYGAYLSGSVTSERSKMTLYRATNLLKAYDIFRSVMTNYTSVLGKDDPWDDALIESAKGAVIYSKVGKEKTVEGLAATSISAVITGKPDTKDNREHIKRIEAVTPEDVKWAARRYLRGFDELSPESSLVSIACGPDKVDKVAEEMQTKWKTQLLKVDDIEDSVFAQEHNW